MDSDNFPFDVGQSVESRSFVKGYRGAWFRSQIKEIRKRDDEVGVVLIYYDFPDEKMRWTKVYHKLKGNRHVMLRPSFPRIYRECELPGVTRIGEVSVAVTDSWKVGDEVDWWNADCYWSGRIVEKIDHEKFKIELWRPPHGEGSIYETSCHLFRPTLEWSSEHGWEVPTPKDGGKSHPCAHLLYPAKGFAVTKSQCDVSSDCLTKIPMNDEPSATQHIETEFKDGFHCQTGRVLRQYVSVGRKNKRQMAIEEDDSSKRTVSG